VTSPREDERPVPDAGREPTELLFGAGRQRAITATRPDLPIKAPSPSSEIISVAGLAQAMRELTREVRRFRYGLRRHTTAMHLLLGVTLVAGPAIIALLWTVLRR